MKDEPAKKSHHHIKDIPPKTYPRGKNNSKEYGQDLVRLASMMRYNNQKIQYCSQICSLNITSINKKSGFRPSKPETFRAVQDFVYHYENYCYRLYAYREKLLQFINAVLPVGYTEKQVRISHLLINPTVRQAGLVPSLHKFQKNSSLSRAIGDRNLMTHRLYFGTEFDHYFRPKLEKIENETQFKKWCKEWNNHIVLKAKLTNECISAVSKLDNEIAEKIINYREYIAKLPQHR